MLGTYDDVAHRLADVFQLRQAAPFDDMTGPFDGLISQPWGDSPATTMAADRPITIIAWYEHGDNSNQPGLLITTPKSGEYPWLSERTSSGSFNSPANNNFNVSHSNFTSGHTSHFEAYTIRNFVSAANNWVVQHVPISDKSANFSSPQSNSVGFTGTDNGALATTRFELYKSRFSHYQYLAGYQWDTRLGPWLALDRLLEDAELCELVRNPWPFLRRYWGDVLFFVSAVTGEDFGPRSWHFDATYGANTSSAPAGYVPFLDYSPRAIRGLQHRPHYPRATNPGAITVTGLAPTLETGVSLEAPTGALGVIGLAPAGPAIIGDLTAGISSVSAIGLAPGISGELALLIAESIRFSDVAFERAMFSDRISDTIEDLFGEG